MPDRKIFSWHFEPIVQIGEHVLLLTGRRDIPARVTWIEPVPWIEIDFGAITAGETTDEREMEELYVEDNEFAQYRMRIQTDNVVLWRHASPKAAVYYATKKVYPAMQPGSIYDAIEPLKRGQLSEFFQYKDTGRYMQLKNTGTSDVTESKLAFFGYIFEFEELPRAEKPYTPIPCVARTGRTTGGSSE